VTPQSSFTVVAPLQAGRVESLRTLLASMNRRPGVVDPENPVVPFGRFERLHFARFVILEDPTIGDIAVHGQTPPVLPASLAFMVDCDGPADNFLADLVARAGPGLKRVFAHCQGFAAGADLLPWMKAHERPAATSYVNWVGRTVRQIREEHALRTSLEAHLDSQAGDLAGQGPRQVGAALRAFVAAERRAGRLTLTDPASTPLGWTVRKWGHLLGVPLALLLGLPFLLLYLPIFAVQLRRRERSDPEVAPRPDPVHVQRLADLEDHEVTNQFSAMGSLKPGRFRRWTLIFILWVVNYTTRHIYTRGYLARVNTIHFAHWIFIDDKQRLLFASNYDGSLDSYMDDFINKVAFGLNVVFSNGVGYPRTRWLIGGGAKDEQKFKYFIRRHQLPTEVWYNACPGLTALDRDRNTRIREGLGRSSMTDAEARDWLRLL
jgi:hypothetical protein